MLNIQKILCPTDFSRCAKAALPIACALARDYGAALIFLHVRPTPESMAGEFGLLPPEPLESEDSLKAKLRGLLPVEYNAAVEYQIRDGDAATQIIKYAQEINCDMLVLGTHGRSGLSRLLLGSVAEAVLRTAPCPLMTVRPSARDARVADTSAKFEPNVNATNLTTVCTLANSVDAEIIRHTLKSEGISSFVENARQAGLVGMLGNPVRIQVRVGDAERASKLIRRQE